MTTAKFTKIENEVLEALIKAGLSITALSCALFLIRKLNGFHKEQDMISNLQIAEGIGKSVRSVINGMEELRLVKITALVKKGVSRKACNIWYFEKDTTKWQLVKKAALVKVRGATSENLCKRLVKETAHTKETIQKKYTKEREYISLKSFKSNKTEIIQTVRDKYKNRDVLKAYEDFTEYCDIKKTSYKNYYLAFLKWVRDDRFDKYKISYQTFTDEDVARIL